MRCGDRRVTSWPSKCTLPGSSRDETGHGPGKGALARPVRAQHGEHRARLDGDGDAEERLRRAVADVEVADVEDGLAHGTVGAARARLAVPEVGGTHGGVVADLLRAPDRDALAEVEHEHGVRQGEHGRDVVLDDHDRERVLVLVDDLPEDGEQVLRRLHVQTGERLVEEEDARVAGQRAADLDQAGHAQRQRGHRGLGDPGQPQHLEQPVDAVVLVLGGREQRAGIEHVPPEAVRARPGRGGPARGAHAP